MNLPEITDWLVVAVGAGYAIAIAVDKGIKKRKQTADTIDEKLIRGLQDTVNFLEKKVSGLETELKGYRDSVHKLRGENEILTKILQGRDEAAIKHYEQSAESLMKINKTLEIVGASNKHIENLYSVLVEKTKIGK